jgi:hypothetical protein
MAERTGLFGGPYLLLVSENFGTRPSTLLDLPRPKAVRQELVDGTIRE